VSDQPQNEYKDAHDQDRRNRFLASLTTEELAAELRRRDWVAHAITGTINADLAGCVANVRSRGAIVIERDENGNWPQWTWPLSINGTLDALASAQEEQT
jgi:hypothetical protein